MGTNGRGLWPMAFFSAYNSSPPNICAGQREEDSNCYFVDFMVCILIDYYLLHEKRIYIIIICDVSVIAFPCPLFIRTL